ncbi:MAG: GldM family protein [Flavobacteriales bacterium]|nr:GldM family protein [Flavobacteriales bacterium]
MKAFLLVAGFGLGLLSYAQDIEEDTPQPRMVASATQMNILYRGVDNPVDVAVPGVPCEQLRVTITNGELTGEGCRYMISPGGGYVTRLTSTWPTPDGLDSSETAFHVRSIPSPQACFGGICTDYDSLLVSHDKAAQGVIARVIDLGFDLRIDVKQYRLRVMRDCQLAFAGVTVGPRLSPEMFEAMQGIHSGDMLIIDDIKALYPDGVEREALPLHLFVK